ncbi:HAD-IA family hydrolase [Bradyrhizobium sp. CB1717]|uniref:HAD-IA family hydrolase n=1 Tax=Bradyrhizobium sp. CB1717 TaxID=3039154 RepID=UPI0024B09B58|nr:HAD-IA family hydrolase [Bradyrhizobium sp. CB1717]WFU25475.1 HAD-IA family hydrolase [Bradyrhizobium sp. CB1717]
MITKLKHLLRTQEVMAAAYHKEPKGALHVRGMIFDVDGTVVDSELASERVWRRWAIRRHVDPERLLATARGLRTIDTLRLFCPPGVRLEDELADLKREEFVETEAVTAVAGAAEFLAGLAPERWAIVTSNTRLVVEARLRHVGLPVPRVLVCAEDVSAGKPDPEGYIKAAAALDCPPGAALAYEDSPAGIEAAQRAGMEVIAICPPGRGDVSYKGFAIRNFVGLKVTLCPGRWMSVNLPPGDSAEGALIDGAEPSSAVIRPALRCQAGL